MNSKKVAEEICNASPCTFTQPDVRDDYTALIESALIAARDEGLEEAARVCDKQAAVYFANMEGTIERELIQTESEMGAAQCIAKAIRALKLENNE